METGHPEISYPLSKECLSQKKITSICDKPEGCPRQINEKIEAIVCLNYGNAKRIHLNEFNFILINIWNAI